MTERSALFQQADLRNVALIGHNTCGKTVAAEAMLKTAGEIVRMGTIEEGTTVSDYHYTETERQISVGAGVMYLSWLGRKINLLDTPGFFDFRGEVKGCLRVADLALVIVNGSTGVEIGTEQVRQMAEEFGVPQMFVVNMLDKEKTDFEGIVSALREHVSKHVLPIFLPVDPGPGFHQIADCLRKKLLAFQLDGSGRYEELPVPADLAPRVDAIHQQLIELIAESDDALMEKFFTQGALSDDELRAALHDAIRRRAVVLVGCMSALTNVGTPRILDLIAKYAPSPADVKEWEGTRPGRDEKLKVIQSAGAPECLYVFKTLSEPHVGELSFFRVFSGTVRSGSDLMNTSRQTSERLGQVFIVNGKHRKEAGMLAAGDIGAVVKLKNTHTGDTLCHHKLEVCLPKVDLPEPNIHAALIAKSKGDEEKLAVGLATLHEEDPTFLFRVDSEVRQTILSGQGETHLEVIAGKLRRRFNVEVELVEPRIPYRETIRVKGESKYRHKKQTGGAGQFAEVWMRVSPLPRGRGVQFTESLVGQNVDRVFVPSVEKGVMAACGDGVLAGFRVTDVAVDFYDGKQHPVDSKDIAFQIAGKEAFREAFLAAHPCLLEPIHEVEVRVPDDHMGAVIGDISGRRGKILRMETAGAFQVIRAEVPQANLYRYSMTLRALTGGRAFHFERPSHYEEVPKESEQKIVQGVRKKDSD